MEAVDAHREASSRHHVHLLVPIGNTNVLLTTTRKTSRSREAYDDPKVLFYGSDA